MTDKNLNHCAGDSVETHKNHQLIAEISSNHHQDLNRCLAIIAAAHIVCSAVKFQIFKVDQLSAPEILAKCEMHLRRKKLGAAGRIFTHSGRADALKMQFSCSFLSASRAIYETFVNFYKIVSYELLWDELRSVCVSTGKPLILSIGITTLPKLSMPSLLRVKSVAAILHCGKFIQV